MVVPWSDRIGSGLHLTCHPKRSLWVDNTSSDFELNIHRNRKNRASQFTVRFGQVTQVFSLPKKNNRFDDEQKKQMSVGWRKTGEWED